MSKSAGDYIEKMRDSNAHLFRGERLIIRPEELTKIVRHAWEDGFLAGQGEKRESLFDRIFGGPRYK